MIDNRTAKEYFIEKFHSNILCKPNTKFALDLMLKIHIRNEIFTPKLSANIIMNSKQSFEFDCYV